MRTRLIVLALFVSVLAGQAARAAAEEIAHDLILAVDVSFSMTGPYSSRFDPKKTAPASDPEGIRWDGIQLAIDMARPHDRIALVLFRGEAIVVTALVDPSGYVDLSRKYRDAAGHELPGRDLLKRVVAEIEEQEHRAGAVGIETYRLDVLDKTTPKISSGTSVVMALRTIEEKLLHAPQEGRQTWTFLLTDGFEERPFDKPEEGKKDDYHYIEELLACRSRPEQMGRLVAGWLAGFRAHKAPIFTFGLGGECDQDLLRLIADKSQPPGRGRLAASYHAADNVSMLEHLQAVEWELRQNWRLPLTPLKDTPEQVLFRTPPIGIWHDLGVLLWRQRGREGVERRALAPRRGSVKERILRAEAAPEQLPAWLQPYRSRSHWYYYLPPTIARPQEQVPVDAQLELLLERQDRKQHVQAVAVARTRQPLFEYQEPRQGSSYTLKDAIPFRVRCTPLAPFHADDFTIEANLIPAPVPGRSETRSPRRLSLTFQAGKDRSEGAFVGELVLDSEPASHGQPELAGPYYVDLLLRGVRGPLQGAERRLIRRTIEVAGYPNLKLPERAIELTNTGPESISATIPVSLSLSTDPARPVATLQARLVEGPVAGPKETIEPALFQLTDTSAAARKGEFRVSLPGPAWAGLPPRHYTAGRIKVRAPWMSWEEAPAVELTVRKKACTVDAIPAAFDLSAPGGGEVVKDVSVKLNSQPGLHTEEPVQLSINAEGETADKLILKPADAGGKEVEVAVTGLAKIVSVAGGEQARRTALPLTLKRSGDLRAGRYTATLYLTGPGITPSRVPIAVSVDQPTILLQQADGKLEPITELYLLGLPGTKTQRMLTVRTALGKEVHSLQPSAQVLDRREGGDHLPQPRLTVDDKKPGRVVLAMTTPCCLREGWYSSRLQFKVDAGAGQELLVQLPLHVQAIPSGVRPDVKGTLRLCFPEPCATSASQEIRLLTDAEKAPVRWWVEQVAATQPGRAHVLPPGTLDVEDGHKKSLLLRKGAASPVTAQQPCPLTVRLLHGNLNPGWYHGTLRFHSYADDPADEGPTKDLDVEVLVPGRVLQAVTPSTDRLAVGQLGKVQVRLACYGCEPGRGELRLLDRTGKVRGAAVPISLAGAAIETDAGAPGLSVHTFTVPFMLAAAGKGRFEVSWPALCPPLPSAASGDRGMSHTFDVDGLGLIRVSPAVSYLSEEVTLAVVLDADSAPAAGQPLLLQAVNQLDANKEPIRLELREEGPQAGVEARADQKIYSIRQAFPRLGDYELRAAPRQGLSVELQPARAHVAFELRQNVTRAGVIAHGGFGALRLLPGINDRVVVAEAVQVINQRSAPCQVRARLRFPTTGAGSANLAELDPETAAAPVYDPHRHLDTTLLLQAGGKEESGRDVSTALESGQEMQVGLDSRLPEAAQDEAHPVLSGPNGMFIEVELHWPGQGGEDLRRVVYVPVSVATSHPWWRALGSLGIGLGVFLIGALILYRFLVSGRGPRPRPIPDELADLGRPRPEEPKQRGLLARLRGWLGHGSARAPSSQLSGETPPTEPALEEEAGREPPPPDDTDDEFLPPHLRRKKR